MAKPAPHLAYDDLAYDRNVPAHMLVRLFDTLEEDGIDTPTTARGGHCRITVIARLGPIHRDNKTVYVTVIFPSASMAGVVHQEHLHAQRVDCTSEQLERMLTGEEKIPSGLNPQLVKKSRRTAQRSREKTGPHAGPLQRSGRAGTADGAGRSSASACGPGFLSQAAA